MGRKVYAAKLLEWTVLKGIEVIAVVTDSHFPNSPTSIKAKSLGIPVVSLQKAEEIVKNEEVDIVISYLFWKKIKEPLISKPKYGCINFHPAILPDWRGTAGYNIAILKKLTKWGATAHYINKHIDEGNIISTFEFNFDYRIETAKSLEEKTQGIQMDLYKKVILDVLEMGMLPSIKQDLSKGTYISRKQMENMKSIDLQNDDIDLKIRAFWFPPYRGANITINDVKYTLINDDILHSLIDDSTTYQK